ncbi:hypothetical protein SAMN05421548_13737 [Paraburkholderia lycopersici]|uniref:Uncharacterized protein n=1 Tax=Paraburkholderia lycopersici TaxID=416944 RepID=A0A1G7B3X4_9BURK|nr:hypothetical protein SAMN05421548_13737 [Paraburkholderia lycopersici]
MLRKTLNASRLQEEMHRRIHRLQEVLDDGVKIGVPRPQRQAPDRSGCNWTMQHFHNAAGFEASVARVLAQVQAEYNLATAPGEAGEHAASTADDARAPFGATKRAAVNPFGEVKPAPAANPFGDARPSGKENPFGGGEPARDEGEQEPARRPRNPFGD